MINTSGKAHIPVSVFSRAGSIACSHRTSPLLRSWRATGCSLSFPRRCCVPGAEPPTRTLQKGGDGRVQQASLLLPGSSSQSQKLQHERRGFQVGESPGCMCRLSRPPGGKRAAVQRPTAVQLHELSRTGFQGSGWHARVFTSAVRST